MRTRFLLAALAVAAIATFATGCGQNEQTETMAEEVEVTCSGGGTCEATCVVDKEHTECVVTCEHADGTTGECTVTCKREGDEMICTATCSGGQDVAITCDGKTITCEHADGSTCTFEHPGMEDGCIGMKVAEESKEAGCAGCPGSKSGGCPGSAAGESEAS